MAINPDKCIKVTGRFHSTQGTVGDPALTNIVSGADEVYDDTAPYRTNGHIDCTTVTPVGTENPKELRWYEQVTYGSGQNTTTEWVRSNDITIDSGKTYGIPTGAKQSDVNDQLYEMTGDTDKVVLYANEYEQITNPSAGANPQANGWYELSGSTYVLTTDTTIVSGKTYYVRVAHISPDENKIINQQDGYIPTAGAVGRAMGANFEDNLQSTSIVKGLTANMGRVLNENKADINGYYETMSVGSAKNLDGENTNSEAYLIRPTGGENNEVVSGLASVVGMEGNSCVWNQLFRMPTQTKNSMTLTNNGDGSFTLNGTGSADFFVMINSVLTNSHKYALRISNFEYSNGQGVYFWSTISALKNKYGTQTIVFNSGSSLDGSFDIITSANSSFTNHKLGIDIIDLTLIGIDNLTTASQVEDWIAQHVGTKPYYAYNAGTILSSQTLGIKTYGQNLLNPTTKQAKLIPYTWVENNTDYSNQYTIKNVPSGATATFTPDATGVAESVTITDNKFDITSYGSGILELSDATANTYVCIRWNGTKDNDVVPYEDHTYDFDVRKVYGKVNGEGEYVQCHPEGMDKLGTKYDYLSAPNTIDRLFKVNLGNLTWTHVSNNNRHIFYTNDLSSTIRKPISDNQAATWVLMSKSYRFVSQNASWVNQNACILYTASAISGTQRGSLMIVDNSYTDAASFKASLAGYFFVYELATPITYTDLIYRDGGIDRPLREVLVNLNVDNWSMEEQLVSEYDASGNPTSVSATIQTKYSIDAVEAIKALEEASYFESDIHDNLQAMLTCINTNCASVLGGQFSISETATNKLFNFTFTANASTNSIEENPETI